MAQLEQERHVELVAGANQLFVITSRMLSAVIPAQLPHLNVFVVNVVSDLDPKQDTLARVATIADLTVLPIGRDAGIATPGPDGKQFLSSAWTASYEDLQTGLDAAKAFQDRINALVNGWISFDVNFNAPDPTPAIYTFPAVDTSQKTQLIAAYKVAKQDRYQKQITKQTADATLTRTQADYTYKQGLVSGVPSGTLNVTEMTSLSGFFDSCRAAGNVFLGANPGGVGAVAFTTALNTAANQAVTAVGFLSDASTLSAALAAYKTARQGEVAAAQTTLTTATTDQATKAAALTAALALESATLAAVIAVCPDFDKHSIPFVDDTEP